MPLRVRSECLLGVKLRPRDGLEGLTRFEAGGSACQMNGEQQENLKAWVAAALPRSTRQIGAWIICAAIGQILGAFTPDECANYFQNSGYAQTFTL
jgi:hypothetical protein